MNDDYHVWLDGKDQGPFSIEALRAMEHNGKIDRSSAVKRATDEAWGSWDTFDARAKEQEYFQRTKAVEEELRPPKTPLQELRSKTAYPEFRGAIHFFIRLNVIAAVILLLCIFAEPAEASIFVIAAVASLFGIVPLALGRVLIDIADCALKKL